MFLAAVHAVLHTPLPVQVHNVPLRVHYDNGPDIIAYIIAAFGLVISGAAAFFAYLAWNATQRAANVTELDYKLNQVQATKADAERARRPDLRLALADRYNDVVIEGTPHNIRPGLLRVDLNFSLANVGDKMAQHTLVELVFPSAFEDGSYRAYGFNRQPAPIHIVDGMKQSEVHIDNAIIQADDTDFSVWADVPPGVYDIAWMAKSGNDGFFPLDADEGGYGHIRTVITGPVGWNPPQPPE